MRFVSLKSEAQPKFSPFKAQNTSTYPLPALNIAAHKINKQPGSVKAMNSNLLRIQHQPFHFRITQTTLHRLPPSSPHLFPRLPFQSSSLSFSKAAQCFKFSSLSKVEPPLYFDEEEEREGPINGSSVEFEDLAENGIVYRRTLRLVECSMFAAVTGLIYFLSNSLAIEVYFVLSISISQFHIWFMLLNFLYCYCHQLIEKCL